MRGIKNSVSLLLTLAMILGTEAAAISDFQSNSQEEIKTVEFEPIPLEVIYAQAGDYTLGERTHDVHLINKEDRDLMLRCAFAEGGNQGEDGMWLIMSVIMNRVENPNFPNSIREVIYQPHQFSVVTDGRIDEVEPTEATEMAMVRIEDGEIAPEIVAFERKNSHVLDEWFTYAFTYRDHAFYTPK